MQGQDTSSEAVANLRTAVQEGKDCSAEVMNYRKNGDFGCMPMRFVFLAVVLSELMC